MELIRLPVDSNLYENTPQGTHSFPLKLHLAEIARYESGSVPWHWHNEVEMAAPARGELIYHVGDSVLTLRMGECLFINAGVLHRIEEAQPYQGMTAAIVADPLLISGHSETAIAKKYVEPIINCTKLPYLHLTPQTGWHRQLIDHVSAARQACEDAAYGYELVVRNELSSFWRLLALNTRYLTGAEEGRVSADDSRIKQMMQYIHTHHAQPVSLAQIAAAAQVSVSECCRCFGRTLSMTPFEYLLKYRINTAARLLLESDDAVTDIASRVGFDTPSYFGKRFKAQFGCTPTEYRKNADR